MSELTQRSYFIDNLKGLLIIFVVIGHFFDVWASSYINIRFIYTFIYLFHMPCFVFISGYLSIDPDKSRYRAFESLLVPYIVMSIFWNIYSGLFSIVMHGYADSIFKFSILNPAYGLWYLQALFIWRYFLKDILRIKYAFVISIFLSLIVGLSNEFSTLLSMSRVIVFLPFFLAGYYVRQNNYLPKILTINKYQAGMIVLITGIVAMLMSSSPDSLYRFLFYHCSFETIGIDPVVGIVTRIMFMYISLMMIFALFNIIPDKTTKLAFIGSNSMVIYIGHFYIANVFHSLFYNQSELYILIYGTVFVFITIWFLSTYFINNMYKRMMSFIINSLFMPKKIK